MMKTSWQVATSAEAFATACRGDTILHIKHIWSKRAQASGTTDEIPENWKFAEERFEELAIIRDN